MKRGNYPWTLETFPQTARAMGLYEETGGLWNSYLRILDGYSLEDTLMWRK